MLKNWAVPFPAQVFGLISKAVQYFELKFGMKMNLNLPELLLNYSGYSLMTIVLKKMVKPLKSARKALVTFRARVFGLISKAVQELELIFVMKVYLNLPELLHYISEYPLMTIVYQK